MAEKGCPLEPNSFGDPGHIAHSRSTAGPQELHGRRTDGPAGSGGPDPVGDGRAPGVRPLGEVSRPHSEGPRMPSARGVRTATGPLAFGAGVRAAPAPRGGAGGGVAPLAYGGGAWCSMVRCARWSGPMTVPGRRGLRTHGRAKVHTRRGMSFVKHRPGYASPGATVSTGCGRSRASPGPTTPSDVTGLLSPADRSRLRNEVPRRGPRKAAGVSSLRLSARGAASTRSPAGRAWLAWHREQRSPALPGHAPYG